LAGKMLKRGGGARKGRGDKGTRGNGPTTLCALRKKHRTRMSSGPKSARLVIKMGGKRGRGGEKGTLGGGKIRRNGDNTITGNKCRASLKGTASETSAPSVSHQGGEKNTRKGLWEPRGGKKVGGVGEKGGLRLRHQLLGAGEDVIGAQEGGKKTLKRGKKKKEGKISSTTG